MKELLGADALLEMLGGRRSIPTKKRTTTMEPGVPGSSATSRRPENRTPGRRRWQALDGTLHRTRVAASRSKGARTLPPERTGPVLVVEPPRYVFEANTGLLLDVFDG